MKKVIFICGLGGDAGMTYVPNLKSFCEDKGYKFYAPHMPGFEDGISYEKYRISFESLIKQEKITDFNDVLIISQSAGTNFIVKYCSENHLKSMWGYISVSGFADNADQNISQEKKEKFSVLKSFKPTDKDYKKFKEMPFKKFSIYGGKDCFFTVKNLEKYADLIGAKKYFDKNGVHCTISENVTTHKLLHQVIEENFD